MDFNEGITVAQSPRNQISDCLHETYGALITRILRNSQMFKYILHKWKIKT